MATADFPVTKCPPGAARNAQFDEHIGMRVKAPIHVRFAAHGEVESTGINWDDCQRMQTSMKHKFASGRETETPAWVMDNEKVQAVVVRFLELRSVDNNSRIPKSGTYAERLRWAHERLKRHKAHNEAALTRLCQRLVAMKKAGAGEKELSEVAAQIENLDTDLRIHDQIAAKAVAVIHLYYRVGLNSTEVGAEIGIKPPHVRRLCLRFRTIAWQLGFGEKPQFGRHGGKNRQPAGPKPVLPKGHLRCARCTEPFQRHNPNQKYCGQACAHRAEVHMACKREAASRKEKLPLGICGNRGCKNPCEGTFTQCAECRAYYNDLQRSYLRRKKEEERQIKAFTPGPNDEVE